MRIALHAVFSAGENRGSAWMNPRTIESQVRPISARESTFMGRASAEGRRLGSVAKHGPGLAHGSRSPHKGRDEVSCARPHAETLSVNTRAMLRCVKKETSCRRLTPAACKAR